ncbi:hypothetical protein Droror1_Dr00016711 [Drosera rotundifolia]
MRVSLCKIQWSHCPSRYICFCTKPSSPSSTHLHKPQSPTTPPRPNPAPVTALIKVDHEDDEKERTQLDPILTHVAHSTVLEEGSIPDPIRLLSGGGDCGGGDDDKAIGCKEGCPDEEKGKETKQQVVETTVGECAIKSSLRRKELVGSNGVEIQKKSVQWMDFLGKDLVEVNEFESSDAGYSDDEGMTNRGCLCNVL